MFSSESKSETSELNLCLSKLRLQNIEVQCPSATERVAAAGDATKIAVRDLNFFYGKRAGAAQHFARDSGTHRDGVHRPVGLWQVDFSAHAESHERRDSRQRASTAKC